MVPHINEQDIIHMSTRNNFLETPFLVVADTKLQKIVIAIRGTLSLGTIHILRKHLYSTKLNFAT